MQRSSVNLRSFIIAFAIFLVVYIVISVIANTIWAGQGTDIIGRYVVPGIIAAVIFSVIYFGFTYYFGRRGR